MRHVDIVMDASGLRLQGNFCQVPSHHVLGLHDVTNIWHVPLLLQAQGAPASICQQLGLKGAETVNLTVWKNTLADRWDNLEAKVNVAMVGKYTDLADAYLSVTKALQHACLSANRKLAVNWVEASHLEEVTKAEDPSAYKTAWSRLTEADGILVPGGFGNRGVEGMILSANFARKHSVPYLGICLGMQVAVIEFARNVLEMKDANSTEFNAATPFPVVVFMPEGSTTHLGGTMRLGSRRTMLQTVDCIAAKLYQADQHINERHRHRYEVNPELIDKFEEHGLRFVGRDEEGRRMEIVELEDHPFFLAAQFHPEFKSRPGKPSPCFLGLILAASGKLDNFLSGTCLSPARLPPRKKVKLSDVSFDPFKDLEAKPRTAG